MFCLPCVIKSNMFYFCLLVLCYFSPNPSDHMLVFCHSCNHSRSHSRLQHLTHKDILVLLFEHPQCFLSSSNKLRPSHLLIHLFQSFTPQTLLPSLVFHSHLPQQEHHQGPSLLPQQYREFLSRMVDLQIPISPIYHLHLLCPPNQASSWCFSCACVEVHSLHFEETDVISFVCEKVVRNLLGYYIIVFA